MRRISGIIVLPLFFAACRAPGERAVIRGDFADSATAPASVVALEAGQNAEVQRRGFELRNLAAGPATLRLVRGTDTTGTLSLGALPAGAHVTLRGLRMDRATGRAFPRTIELTGADLVTVNGLRMAPDARLPAEVDAGGVVLALADDRDAALVRPDDPSLPDLKVVIGLSTETVSPDGDPVPVSALRTGDAVRVLGRTDEGFVVASRLIIPRRAAVRSESSRGPAAAERETASSSGGDGGNSERVARTESRPVAAPVVERGPVREPRGNGRGHGRGGGKGRKHFVLF